MFAICHTHYSLQTGIGSPQEWVEAAVQRGYEALAIADVNGLYGAVEFAKAAAAAGPKSTWPTGTATASPSPLYAMEIVSHDALRLSRVKVRLVTKVRANAWPPSAPISLCATQHRRSIYRGSIPRGIGWIWQGLQQSLGPRFPECCSCLRDKILPTERELLESSVDPKGAR